MQIRKYSMERNNSLQSIRYNTGSLQLLDQVPLSQFKSIFFFLSFCFVFIFGLYNSQKATISLLNLDFVVVVVVVEQRKLPLEAIYLDIKDAKDGW